MIDLVPGREALVLVTVRSVSRRTTRNRRTMVTAQVGDGSGRLSVVFFNQPWRERQLQPGLTVALFGRADTYRGSLQMTNPVVDLIGDRTGRIVPIYPQSEKADLNTWEMAGWVESALERCRARGIADPVPEPALRRFGLVDRQRALFGIHAPGLDGGEGGGPPAPRLRRAAAGPARPRPAQAGAGARRQGHPPRRRRASWCARFHERLPFALTDDQRTRDRRDRRTTWPARTRCTGCCRATSGRARRSSPSARCWSPCRAATRARSWRRPRCWPSSTAATVRRPARRRDRAGAGRASSGDRPAARRAAHEPRRPARSGATTLAGAGRRRRSTWSSARTRSSRRASRSASLGVVVIDEQHRFGVEQRAALRAKGERARRHVPDVLVMTATPIPRTAAMTVYGDLDVSDARRASRPGAQPIVTTWANGPLMEEAVVGPRAGRGGRGPAGLRRVPAHRGARQARGGVGRGDLRAARPRASWPGCASACCTAGCRRPRRRRSWAGSGPGELDVLVATTVIEVGVDVPNATVMVILDADRFGIAQLHQLRGRVGRGARRRRLLPGRRAATPDEPSARVAGAGATPPTASSWPRSTSTCGARARSWATAQKGRNDLKLASLRRDRELVAQARESAFAHRRRGPGPRGPARAARRAGPVLRRGRRGLPLQVVRRVPDMRSRCRHYRDDWHPGSTS